AGAPITSDIRRRAIRDRCHASCACASEFSGPPRKPAMDTSEAIVSVWAPTATAAPMTVTTMPILAASAKRLHDSRFGNSLVHKCRQPTGLSTGLPDATPEPPPDEQSHGQT